MAKTVEQAKDREIVITRSFSVPRKKVWNAWAKPSEIEQWWGPRGFTTRVDEMNFEVGGSFKYIMVDAEGNEYPTVGEFRLIEKPERIVATDEFGDSDQNRQVAPEGLPTGMITTTTFEQSGEKTILTITIMHQSIKDRKKHEEMGVIDGFNEQLDKLEEYFD